MTGAPKKSEHTKSAKQASSDLHERYPHSSHLSEPSVRRPNHVLSVKQIDIVHPSARGAEKEQAQSLRRLSKSTESQRMFLLAG